MKATKIRATAVWNTFAAAVNARTIGVRTFTQKAQIQLELVLAYGVSAARSNDQVIEDWRQSKGQLDDDVALFVHFDPHGSVNADARRLVRELANAGRSVVFVTNSGSLFEDDWRFLRIHCAGILIRRNVGYDFGAWRNALDTFFLPRENTRSILLVNDSIIGPFDDLQNLLDKADHQAADVWGITESWQLGYHLQSFFLSCGPVAIRSEAWRRFWNSVRPVPSKNWIIRRYEVGFTKALSSAGLRCRPLFPTARLLDEAEQSRLAEIADPDAMKLAVNPGAPGEAIHAARILRTLQESGMMLNPSADLWRQLLKAGFPFVKRELVTRNPTSIADVSDWRGVVEQAFPVGVALQHWPGDGLANAAD